MAHTTFLQPLPESSPSAPPRMTYEEFLDWLDSDTWAEWANGEVITMSPVSEEQPDLGGFILGLIRHFAEAYDLGKVFYEPFQMKTGPNLPGRSPDIFSVAKKNLSRVKKTYLKGPADLVVEIVSPESRSRDRGEKYYEYEEGGVAEYWMLDYERQQAEFYGLGKDGLYHLLPVDEGVFRSRVLKGLWLKVDWFWQKPLPPLMKVLKEWKLVP